MTLNDLAWFRITYTVFKSNWLFVNLYSLKTTGQTSSNFQCILAICCGSVKQNLNVDSLIVGSWYNIEKNYHFWGKVNFFRYMNILHFYVFNTRNFAVLIPPLFTIVITPSSAMFNQLMITILKEASHNWKKNCWWSFSSHWEYMEQKFVLLFFYCTFLRFQNGKKGDKITKIFYFFPCWAFF